MKGFAAAGAILLALSLVLLSGCTDSPLHIDPLAINGRDGGGKPVTYDALMRIGAAARSGGDLANAVSIYRRAAALDSHAPAPFAAAGETLLAMNQTNEAIVAFNSALERDAHYPAALRGLAKAYLATGRPELAGHPLAIADQDSPNDPKLLELIGVTDDFAGRHRDAQARYRRGLALLPGDAALSLDLALSLALTGDYAQAIAILRPFATARGASPRERQTLALIYGLSGDAPAAERLARIDLDPASVQHNLAFYETLRRLSPEARSRAILSASASS